MTKPALDTIGDLTTVMLSYARLALINRHLSPQYDLAKYTTTIDELKQLPHHEENDDLFAALGVFTQEELSALMGAGAAMLADLMLELSDGNAQAAKASLERMMLKVRQEEVGL